MMAEIEDLEEKEEQEYGEKDLEEVSTITCNNGPFFPENLSLGVAKEYRGSVYRYLDNISFMLFSFWNSESYAADILPIERGPYK